MLKRIKHVEICVYCSTGTVTAVAMKTAMVVVVVAATAAEVTTRVATEAAVATVKVGATAEVDMVVRFSFIFDSKMGLNRNRKLKIISRAFCKIL